MSPSELRILSELRHCRRRRGTSPTDLARRAGLAAPTIYVLLRRLAKRRWVSRRRDSAPGVTYIITAAGLAARELFARKVGLRA